MHLVTGGAGFIGSNVVAQLCEDGHRVVVCDWLGDGDKWFNLRGHDVWDVVFPNDLEQWLEKNRGEVEAIVHMGAISATTERDVDLIIRSNLHLSDMLWRFAAAEDAPFIYASSAATYGDGEKGFRDEFTADALASLRPLNPYGWSKHVFDRKVFRTIQDGGKAPAKWAGLKFFNVYGPNEYHKGSMRSVIATHYASIASGEALRLFKSDRNDYSDGGQMRDFIYVRDCVQVIRWMLTHQFEPSVYNIGTGSARTWFDLGKSMFAAANIPERIEFVDMPGHLRGKYQYFTEADMAKLAGAGYDQPFTSLEDGVGDYITNYLGTDAPYR